MSMQTDILAASLAATGTAYSGRTRLRGLTISFATGGTVVIRDGGASGVTMYSYTAPATAGTLHIILPGEGILFQTDMHATLSSATAILYYD